MLDHGITIRDVLYASGLSVGAVAAAFGLYVVIAWLRMRREYRNAINDDSE